MPRLASTKSKLASRLGNLPVVEAAPRVEPYAPLGRAWWPDRSLVEVAGDPQSGRSSVARYVASESRRAGMPVLWLEPGGADVGQPADLINVNDCADTLAEMLATHSRVAMRSWCIVLDDIFSLESGWKRVLDALRAFVRQNGGTAVVVNAAWHRSESRRLFLGNNEWSTGEELMRQACDVRLKTTPHKPGYVRVLKSPSTDRHELNVQLWPA